MKMKMFSCTNFEGLYPVGTAAVVVAPDEEAARQMLESELKKRGHTGRQGDGSPITLREINAKIPEVLILCDGNY